MRYAALKIDFNYNAFAEEIDICSSKLVLTSYPNPFSSSTTIYFNFTTENREHAEIVIYNIKGQKIKTFDVIPKVVEGAVMWDGRDEKQKKVGSGIYFNVLKTGNEKLVGKMVLLE